MTPLTLTITDNETTGVTLSSSSVEVNESGAVNTAVYTVLAGDPVRGELGHRKGVNRDRCGHRRHYHHAHR